jgi:threonyl-tRNA synthetase
MLIIGGKEQEAGTISVRARDGEVRYGVKTDEFLAELKKKIETFA